MGYRVLVHFEGSVEVEVATDPENTEIWYEAMGDAIVGITSDDMFEAMEATGHEVIGQKDTEKCSNCGTRVPYIIGCPDGQEVCQECFDNGVG